jgi:type II secretory pathway pseudopilin PulG
MRSDGFSLLELLVYMALLAIVMLFIGNIFIGINTGRGKGEAQVEVNSNLRFAFQKIEADLRAATSVTTPASGSGSGASISFIQAASSSIDASAISVTSTFSTANTTGSLIVATVSMNASHSVTCTDSKGNVYVTSVNAYNVAIGQSMAICYAKNIKNGTNTVTATLDATDTYRRLQIFEYSGLDATAPFDASSSFVQASLSTTTSTSNSAVTTANGDLIFGAVEVATTPSSLSAGNGFTKRLDMQDGSTDETASEDMIQATAGSVSSTFTFGTAELYINGMVAFKAAGSVGAITYVQNTGIDCTAASSSNCTKAFGSNVTQNDLLVYLGTSGSDSLGGTPPDIATTTDTQANTWTCRPQHLNTGAAIANIGTRLCWAIAKSTGADTVAQSLSGGSGQDNGFAIVEFSGADTSNPFDTEAAAFTTSTLTSVTSTAYSTVQANEVAVALAVSDDTCNTWTAGTGFTLLANFAGCFTITPRAEYQIYSSVQSSVKANATYSPAASYMLAIEVGVFKAASGSGGVGAKIRIGGKNGGKVRIR